MSSQAEPGHFMARLSLDLPADILKLIGRVSVAYGQLEQALAVTLKRTSGGKISLAQAEALVVSLSSFPALKEKTVKQFGVWALDQAKEAQLDILLQEADSLAKRRHDVAHGFWCLRDGTDELHWKRGDKELGIDKAQLEKLGDDIVDLARRINALTKPSTEELHVSLSASSTFSWPGENLTKRR